MVESGVSEFAAASSYNLRDGATRIRTIARDAAFRPSDESPPMSESLPTVYLARHGETAWSLSGQHTGLTDLPLTERGEANARDAWRSLARTCTFATVLTSPLQRAYSAPASSRASARVAQSTSPTSSNGTMATTRAAAPPRSCRNGRAGSCSATDAPDGESPADVGARADRVIARVRAVAGDVLMFSSGHILRVLGARWLGLPPGRRPVFPARNRRA